VSFIPLLYVSCVSPNGAVYLTKNIIGALKIWRQSFSVEVTCDSGACRKQHKRSKLHCISCTTCSVSWCVNIFMKTHDYNPNGMSFIQADKAFHHYTRKLQLSRVPQKVGIAQLVQTTTKRVAPHYGPRQRKEISNLCVEKYFEVILKSHCHACLQALML